MRYERLGESNQHCALRNHRGGARSRRHGEGGGCMSHGCEGGVMMEVLPLTLGVAGRGCDCAGHEEKCELGEMHCNGFVA